MIQSNQNELAIRSTNIQRIINQEIDAVRKAWRLTPPEPNYREPKWFRSAATEAAKTGKLPKRGYGGSVISQLHGAGYHQALDHMAVVRVDGERYVILEPYESSCSMDTATDGVIIVGHTRLKAAKKLGLDRVPVLVASHLTPDQVRAYRIADNKTNELADWNYDLLPIEIDALKEANYDLGLLGFDYEELAKIMGNGIEEGLTDPDDVPLPPDEAITQPGDLWILGNHRLLCGDSSNPDHLDRLLNGQPIHLCNTDPPYNVKVEPRSKNAIAAGLSSFTNNAASSKLKNDQGMAAFTHAINKKNKAKAGGVATVDVPRQKMRAKDRPLANDFVSDDEFDHLLESWFGNIARVLVPGGSFYIWGGYGNCGNYPPVLKKHDLYFSQSIIWVKEHPVMTRKNFLGNHEWAFFGWKLGAGHKFYGPKNITDVWSVKKVTPQSMEHLTQKPVELAVRAIQYSSLLSQNVLDLFGGSGSTMIGAEQTGRNAFLMELDMPYCDVIVDRMQRFSGKPAILERTGESPIPMGTREENMR